VDTRPGEDWPRCGRSACDTGCKDAIDYDYSPNPANLDPPIPRQAMMHFFHNPSHAGSKTFHYNTVPKRRSELILGDVSLKPGWALVFQEKISWEKIAVVEAVIGLSSLAFAIGWSKTHNGNVQDAFAPSAWMLAAGAIIMTLVYRYE
jgi:hypothetical protein